MYIVTLDKPKSPLEANAIRRSTTIIGNTRITFPFVSALHFR
jgi:hypothetical protein